MTTKSHLCAASWLQKTKASLGDTTPGTQELQTLVEFVNNWCENFDGISKYLGWRRTR